MKTITVKLGNVIQRPNGTKWVVVTVRKTGAKESYAIMADNPVESMVMAAMSERGLHEREFIHTIWNKVPQMTSKQMLTAELLLDNLRIGNKDFAVALA